MVTHKKYKIEFLLYIHEKQNIATLPYFIPKKGIACVLTGFPKAKEILEAFVHSKW